MKYKELSVDVLRKLYKAFYKTNDKTKEFTVDVVYSQEDPNKNLKYADFGKFIPSGSLEEKKNFSVKKSIIYEDYLLSTKSLPYPKNVKAPYKVFYLPGKIQYNKNSLWLESSLQICRPNNLIANNYLNNDLVWIVDDKTKITKNKEKPMRKSPTESATLFSINTIKVGNDGNNWIIIETKNRIKRWKLVKD